MGKPSMSEMERRGMASIRALHETTMGSTRMHRHLRGLGSEDTRLRHILEDIDTSDPAIVDAWGFFIRTVLVGRSRHRSDDRDRQSLLRRPTSTEDRSLRQQYIEHGDEDDYRPRARLTRRHGPISSALRSRLGADSSEGMTRSPVITGRPRYTPLAEHNDWEWLNAASPYEVVEHTPPHVDTPAPVGSGSSELFHWLRSEPMPPFSALETDDAPPPVGDGSVPNEPPAALDRASPAPEAGVASRSSSPDPASRAWLAEYESSAPRTGGSSSVFSLGRRRRDDDDGPSTRRRLRHTDGGRDTRRDAIILESDPLQSWYENLVSNAGSRQSATTAWRVQEDTPAPEPFGVDEGDTAAAERSDDTLVPDAQEEASLQAARHGLGLSRTMSVSAVGRGSRPVAPLPRRHASLLSGVEQT